jgi:hypothetical protein
MDCKKVKEQINRIFDGFEIKDTAVLSHIKRCKKCLNEYNAVIKIKDALYTKEKIKVPDNFNKMVWNKIGELPPSIFDFNQIFAPKMVFAASFIILFLIFLGIFIVKDKFININKEDFIYKNERIAEKDLTAAEKKAMKQDIKTIDLQEDKKEIETKKQEVVVLNVKDEKQLIKEKEIEQKKSEEISYDTYAYRAEDIKTINNNGQKITIAEIKKEPDKIETPDMKSTREDFKVLNNIINPTRDEKVVIQYKTQNAYPVKIIIYDRNGEVVTKLVDENKNPGVYETQWDGRDSKGRIAGAGIYFIYLKTDILEKRIKVLVVK